MGRLSAAMLVAAVVLGVLFHVVPALDLAPARALLGDHGRFPLEFDPRAARVNTAVRHTAIATALAVTTVGLAALVRRAPVLGLRGPDAAFVAIVFLLGPGLLVNVIAKPVWGRARPVDSAPFGGPFPFTPAFGVADGHGRSFVSGEAATGFAFLAFTLLLDRHRAAASLVPIALGGAIGALRMLQGRHFLSDVVFAGFAVAIPALALRDLFVGSPRPWLRLYGALSSVVTWGALVPWLVLRGRVAELPERLGRGAPSARGSLLVHGVSAGEIAAAGALVDAWRRRGAAPPVVLTTSTAEGRAMAERLRAMRPEIAACVFLPWDRPAVAGWLRRVSPAAVVVVETEIWPALFDAARGLGIPLVVASGRIYPRDVPRYRIARRFFADVLACASWIGVQSEAERDAFVAIGAPPERVEVAGNLKHDAEDPAPLPDAWRRSLAGRTLLLGASTHDPEESWLLDVAVRLRHRFPGLGLVVAPRHVRRTAQVDEAAAARGLVVARWSSGPADGWDVLVVDEVGVLPALPGACAVAFVGGSLVPHGGHNPRESAAHGCPVLIGPHVEHFRADVDELRSAGALAVVESVDELEAELARLLDDPVERQRRGEAGRAWCASRRGVADRYAEVLASLVGGSTP